MRKLLTTAARWLRDRSSWHVVGIVLSCTIIAIAAVTLFHILQDVDLAKVLTALRATPPQQIALAAALVALAYLTLTFYDLFALRTIGKMDVPYRVAAFASFTSYSIGHNIGATVFTGGAVRFRIYSAWGLNIIDVTKIAFVTGLTFWLGNAFVLGLGMAYEPYVASEIDKLPAAINRLLGLGGLAAIIGYLVWLLPRKRVIGRSGWLVTLPNAPLTIVQIVLGILDLGFSGLAMYVLVPNDPPLDFVNVLVAFVLATLLGFASHAPGGFGVFDAAMLLGLPQYSKEELLAALLLFRLLYYVTPFALALTFLGTRELWLSLRSVSARGTGEAPDRAVGNETQDRVTPPN
jgi:glycosyltransferase 2 family protein